MQKLAFSTKLYVIGCLAVGLFIVMALMLCSGAQPLWVDGILTGVGIAVGVVSLVTLRSGVRACRQAGMDLTGSWQQLAAASGQFERAKEVFEQLVRPEIPARLSRFPEIRRFLDRVGKHSQISNRKVKKP